MSNMPLPTPALPPEGALPAPPTGDVPDLPPEIRESISSIMQHLADDARAYNIKLAFARRRARGEVAGQIPYGWLRDGSRLVPNAAEQRAISRMIELRAAKRSLSGIARDLQQEGYAPRGARWYPQAVGNCIRLAAAQGERARHTCTTKKPEPLT